MEAITNVGELLSFSCTKLSNDFNESPSAFEYVSPSPQRANNLSRILGFRVDPIETRVDTEPFDNRGMNDFLTLKRSHEGIIDIGMVGEGSNKGSLDGKPPRSKAKDSMGMTV